MQKLNEINDSAFEWINKQNFIFSWANKKNVTKIKIKVLLNYAGTSWQPTLILLYKLYK